MLSQSLVVGAIATVGLVAGVIPDLSARSHSQIFNSAAFAQSNDEIRNYAKAVLAMEPVRQQAFDEVKRITGGNPPAIACNRPESFSQLPGNARAIVANYCRRSKEIVESNGIGINLFNDLTARLQKGDANLKQRISQELMRLQNGK